MCAGRSCLAGICGRTNIEVDDNIFSDTNPPCNGETTSREAPDGSPIQPSERKRVGSENKSVFGNPLGTRYAYFKDSYHATQEQPVEYTESLTSGMVCSE